MFGAILLFAIPILLFVAAFLYETYLSFTRLKNPNAGKSGYISASWETSHTLLVFAIIMLTMMFTPSIENLAGAIFTATFFAAATLSIRAILYVYIFYVRKNTRTSWVDWLFALSHVAGVLFLVVVVLQALVFIYTKHPVANSQFLPQFLPGLIVVILICIIPAIYLYKQGSRYEE